MWDSKDKIFVGVVAGCLANIARNSLGLIVYTLNYKEILTWHIAASVYFPEDKVHTIPALIIGVFTDYAIASTLGIITIYILYYTGTDHFIIKGLTISALAWIFIFGVVLQTEIGRINPVSASTNISYLIGHLLLGILTSGLIVKYGKKALER